MGARMPLCSMTMRVAMGCSFGAEVVPGIVAAARIASQMSSGFRTPAQASRPALSAGSSAGRQRRKGRPWRSGTRRPSSSRAKLPRTR